MAELSKLQQVADARDKLISYNDVIITDYSDIVADARDKLISYNDNF